jgi:alanine-glyoxylate transaminase / serine-glyoxylate transaminase / serine-pyruvate transaminase
MTTTAAPAIPKRLLLGPGPSPVSDRVMRAMSQPVLSHLDPAMVAILDEVRERLARVFQAGPGAFSFAVSGTGTSGMEAAVANLTQPGARAVVVVSGYFGDRLAQMLQRYGATVSRVDVEWGRACDPAQLERALEGGAEVVAMVHAETSTGVLNPVADLCAVAAKRGAVTIVDAVTSLGAHPVEAGKWRADAVYSCTQKGLGAPSGLAPITFSKRAMEFAENFRLTEGTRSREASRSFYLDVQLLHDFWVNRKYHHTISAPLVYALREALAIVEEEGLQARWDRHRDTHLAFASGLEKIGLRLLPAPPERLWSLNAVVVPDDADEAAVRKQLLQQQQIEIGAGLGPLAGRIWRIGLMGSGATRDNADRLVDALKTALRR